ncbi:MAG: phospholipid scramblase-related protein [Bdellovibrionota bacterium]
MLDIETRSRLFVKQRFEGLELLGIESRNKYEILGETGESVGFAAEQSQGFFGWLSRQFAGHWRSFEIHVFGPNRDLALVVRHPFRFFFQRLDVSDANGRSIGAIQRRFSILSKCFDVEDARGEILLTVRSPLWRMWNFPFHRSGQEVACVTKKWTGLLAEAFTDMDNFLIDFASPSLSVDEKQLILAAALYIDLNFFETRAGENSR